MSMKMWNKSTDGASLPTYNLSRWKNPSSAKANDLVNQKILINFLKCL